MNTRKYMFKNSLVACFACCCISFASAGNPPFFPTDVVANAKGELLMTDKGVKRVDVFSPDGKTLLRSFGWRQGICDYIRNDRSFTDPLARIGQGGGFYSDRFGSMSSDVWSGQEAYICM